MHPDHGDADASQPYPFFLASPLEVDPSLLGDAGDWLAEWKWDGIRSQLIRRAGQTFIWSRGEDLVTDRFPELAALGDALPEGVVIDGEILPWRDGKPMPFGQLQQRIGRKNVTKKILADVPVTIVANDRRAINRESPRAFRASCAGGGIRKSKTPIRSRRSRGCCRNDIWSAEA